jgi:hypothetical protein
MNGIASALSGLRSAELRLAASAHNVANLLTDDFHPLRAVQYEQGGGGSYARLERADAAQAVDPTLEVVEQLRAGLQFRASLRVLEVEHGLAEALLEAAPAR